VTDDEPDVLSVVSNGLTQYGYEADGFTDPLEALAHFQAGLLRFDIT
jgi:hypothetical protein